MRKFVYAGLLAAAGFMAVGAAQAAPSMNAAPQVQSANSLMQPVYWTYGPWGRRWVPEHYHHRHEWVDRWGHRHWN